MRYFILCTALCIMALGCSPKAPVRTVINGFAQGGTYHIVIIDPKAQDHLQRGIDSLLEVIDGSMSLYRPDSRLSRLNSNTTDTLDDFIIGCIRQAEPLSRESGGRYDLTIKPLVDAYGFGAGKGALRPNLDSILPLIGYNKIEILGQRLVKAKRGTQLDLNSIAQGASADYLSAWLESQGLENYLVEVGGEIFCRGHNASGGPWTVGIDKPFEGNFSPGADLQVRIKISDCGLATSGNYRKYYIDPSGRKVVHTIDARNGKPIISPLLSATIIAPSSTLADAYGTLCMILGLEESITLIEAHPELEAYLVYSDSGGNYQVYMSEGMRSLVAE